MHKKLSVNAIQEGTVIDHIRAGQGLQILSLLDILKEQQQITIGIHLKSRSMHFKDLIKIERLFLTEAETAEIALFSPMATVNVIRDYQVCHKYKVQLPSKIEGLFKCPNHLCIVNSEPISSCFDITASFTKVFLRCVFCGHLSSREEMVL